MAYRRESTMPMEYEWEDKQGPVDPKSPFMNISQNHNSAKKRPHSVLDSPSKGGFSTPNRPQLREPLSQHFLFNQPDPKPSAVPSRVWEPRTPSTGVDFSSGGETPNTIHEDSEATPDTGLRDRMGRMMSDENGKISPKKPRRRESWFSQMFSRSPGKSESRSKSPAKHDSRPAHYSNKAENRVMKRRQKKALVRQFEEEEDSEDGGVTVRRRNKASSRTDAAPESIPLPPQAAGSSIGNFFTFIERHPSLPHVLSIYLQFIMNLFLVLFAMYIVYSCWSAIMSEVDLHSKDSMTSIMVEIADCARQYRDNRCDPATRIPHMENVCSNWEMCMQRDPRKVARASVSAKTWAKIFNSFIEEFSYKSMIFTAIMIIGGLNLSNWAFGLFRSKQQLDPHPHNSSFAYPPPPTPQRYPSNGYLEHHHQTPYYPPPYGGMLPAGALPAGAGAATPSRGAAMALEQGNEGGDRDRDEGRSPVKRLLFR